MNQSADQPADEPPTGQMDLSPEILDQWELELEQFAKEISRRLARVSSVVKPTDGAAMDQQNIPPRLPS